MTHDDDGGVGVNASSTRGVIHVLCVNDIEKHVYVLYSAHDDASLSFAREPQYIYSLLVFFCISRSCIQCLMYIRDMSAMACSRLSAAVKGNADCFAFIAICSHTTHARTT